MNARQIRWYLVLALVLAVFLAHSAHAQGGMNLHGYCLSLGYSGGTTNIDGTAYGWRCVAADGSVHDMSLSDLCSWQYGGSLPVPNYANYNDPNSWMCYPSEQSQPPAAPPAQPPAPPQQPQLTEGGMDIAGYCDAIGRPGSNVPTHAYEWTCGGVGIEMSNLCAWQYGGALPYPGLREYHDPNSWYCASSPQYVDAPDGGGSSNGSSGGSNSGSSSNSGGSNNGGGGSNSSNNSSGSSSCPTNLSRLSVGAIAYVNDATPSPANVRSGAGTGHSRIDRLAIRSLVTIIGGPVCADGWVWWEVGYNGRSGWIAEVDAQRRYNLVPNGTVSNNSGSGGNSGGSSNDAESNSSGIIDAGGNSGSATLNQEGNDSSGNSSFVSVRAMGYTLSVNPRTCAITNGAEVIRREVQSFHSGFPFDGNLNAQWTALQNYFSLDTGRVEILRLNIQEEISSRISNCQRPYYLVGDLYMDLNGLGNVVYGYFFEKYPWVIEEVVADYYQGVRDGFGNFPYYFQTFVDFPDDRRQRALGRSLANQTGSASEITEEMIISTADQVGLQ